MAKILTITLNPAIDITIELETLHVGAVNRQQHVQLHAAGKGLNVAQVLHDLGHDVIVSGFLGVRNREIFDRHFEEMHFENQFIYIPGETRQNVKIAEHSGRMTDINGKGFLVSESDKQRLMLQIHQAAKEVECVVIGGSLPQGFSVDDLKALMDMLQKANKLVAIDTSGEALVAAISMHPWMIKPNTDELEESYGKKLTELSEQIELFKALDSRIEHVVISMGEDGVHWLNPAQALKSLPPKVEVKSTVGAGDSLLAGMIHGLVSKLSAEETLQTATAIASNAVSQIGFRVPTEEKLLNLKQQTTIKSLS
ncbi:1-phosphofructokinase [Acinetobacter soli]|uniref:1-phosphofructokinase n=1 Tax=Acinetobacter soli TaxID=487316 RepID=UPI001BAA3715|nr:1-phosphofructokinase [Acinetobacter soli]